MNIGRYGFRDRDLGTFFGMSIAEMLIKHAQDMEWKKIFDKVSQIISND